MARSQDRTYNDADAVRTFNDAGGIRTYDDPYGVCIVVTGTQASAVGSTSQPR